MVLGYSLIKILARVKSVVHIPNPLSYLDPKIIYAT
jgi:hypothetical protein